MLVLTPPQVRREVERPVERPRDALQGVAEGIGQVRLLLDLGLTKEAKVSLRAVQAELQGLRRSR